MSTTTTEQTTLRGLEARVLNEGYGHGAWHGPDLKAALADVTTDLAFWRPANGRHNIAEIALHHAFCARAVARSAVGKAAGVVRAGRRGLVRVVRRLRITVVEDPCSGRDRTAATGRRRRGRRSTGAADGGHRAIQSRAGHHLPRGLP